MRPNLRKTDLMASAKATTRKLTGKAKDNFFDAGLSPEEAKAAVTSLQVRKDAWPLSKDLARSRTHSTASAPTPEAPPASEVPPASETAPSKPAATPVAEASSSPPATPPAPAPDGVFDPYVFGLVPIFKREGVEGLSARLNDIGDIEDLRAMAKAQQIVLPREVRRGAASLEAVRSAILAAVDQRVSDRKAQL
ncbi:MAG: hypothetical protein APF80_09510 [Alphaproteobacteria bacterium BRH_c36]|nr:MAG: hypothetical protein APF80_09510 [Alphaproteobacteria bacterium BRH_c36]